MTISVCTFDHSIPKTQKWCVDNLNLYKASQNTHFYNPFSTVQYLCRVATNLENSGNFKNCQNLRENSEKFGFSLKKKWKTRGKHRTCGIIAEENVFQ